MFANQQALDVAALKKSAADLGLDADKFATCLDAGKYTDKVRAGMQEGTALGVGSTPTVFINGRLLTGAQPYEAFRQIIDDELQRAGRR
jgi:protein-disulfide isomerase